MRTPLDPDGEVEITIEEVADFSDVPQDILDSQYKGLLERMKIDEWATEDEVETAFRRMRGSRAE